MKARPVSDEVLIERLLPSANDDSQDRALAWREWYESVGEAAVLAFVRAKNNTPEPDMDILQEAMVVAYVQVEQGQYEPREGIPFAAYVKGIARNKIREARRRARRFVSLEDFPEPLLEGRGGQPEQLVECRERREVLHEALEELPPRRRQVLTQYLKGHSTAEIAEILEMSRASVRQHKSRGVRSLRQVEAFAL